MGGHWLWILELVTAALCELGAVGCYEDIDTTEDDSGGVTIWKNGGLNNQMRKNSVLYHLGVLH